MARQLSTGPKFTRDQDSWGIGMPQAPLFKYGQILNSLAVVSSAKYPAMVLRAKCEVKSDPDGEMHQNEDSTDQE